MHDKTFVDLYLKNGFAFEEAVSEIDFICEALFDYAYSDYIKGMELSEPQKDKIKSFIEERVKTRKPMQHIIGAAYFCGKKFEVSSYTLVPRPETEILVDEVSRIASIYDKISCLDIGTGTGCIPISCILKNERLNFDAVDISKCAIETAERNAEKFGVSEKINFIMSDLFENIDGKYDIIVSNPPYIPLKDRETLEIEVKDFDPAAALFAPDENGVYFYDKIIKNSKKYLKPGGFTAFELGINQAALVKEMFVQSGFSEINIIKDLDGIDRVISARI